MIHGSQLFKRKRICFQWLSGYDIESATKICEEAEIVFSTKTNHTLLQRGRNAWNGLWNNSFEKIDDTYNLYVTYNRQDTVNSFFKLEILDCRANNDFEASEAGEDVSSNPPGKKDIFDLNPGQLGRRTKILYWEWNIKYSQIHKE